MTDRPRVAMLVWTLLLPAFLHAQEGAKPPEAPAKVKLSFSGMDLMSLAQQVERATQKSFLYQEDLLKNKKVSLESPTPISAEEFYRVFQSICLMNGLVLVPVEGAEIDLVKIVQTNQGQKEPGAQPVLVKGQALPEGDTLVYYLLSPRNISPAKATAVISTALSSSGVIQQVQNSDLLLVIDVATAIARAEKVLSLVDVPGVPVVSETATLSRLQAPQAKGQLSEFLQAMEKAATGETGRGRLNILVDERLNALHLVGPEGDVRQAQDFLKRIDKDVPSAKRTVGYYKLKNVPVLDIVDIVRELLGLAVVARGGGEGRSAASEPFSPLAGRPAVELAGGPVLPPTVIPPGGAAAPEAEAPGAPAPRGGARAGRAAGGLGPPGVEIVPLEGMNTLVVIGEQAIHDEVKAILAEIDVRKSQCLMEAAIIQVTGDDSLDTGVEALFEDTLRTGETMSVGTGFGLGAQADTNASGFPDLHNVTGITGGAFRFTKPRELSALLRILATRSNVNIVSQPLLLVNDNEEANFTTKVSEPTIATSQGTATTTTSFAGFAEAVTSLKIVTHLSPDGYCVLKISQDFEEFSGSSTPGSGVPPAKISNSVTTNVTVPDRHTVIIGGFTRDSATETRTGIPVLMEVPGLNLLTSSKSTRVTKSRLYLLIRPRILTGFGELRAVSREKMGNVEKLTTGSPIESQIKEALLPIEESTEEERKRD